MAPMKLYFVSLRLRVKLGGHGHKARSQSTPRRGSGRSTTVLSSTHKGLLEKLFEQEVPEIYEKIVPLRWRVVGGLVVRGSVP